MGCCSTLADKWIRLLKKYCKRLSKKESQVEDFRSGRPALVISKGSRNVVFYDLTTPPPVLVTAEPSAVRISDGSSWRMLPSSVLIKMMNWKRSYVF